MRVYVQDRDNYYLVDTFEYISLFVYREDDCRIRISTEDSDNGGFEPVSGVDESTARRELERLLRFTSDAGEGTAIISWDGKQFTRRVL